MLFIGALMAASFCILRPFLGAFIWAIMIVVATWPLMPAMQRARRRPLLVAVTVMSVLLLLVLIGPLSHGLHLARMPTTSRASCCCRTRLPPPPDWPQNLPLVGERVAAFWQNLATGGIEAVVVLVTPYAGVATRWLVAQAGGLGALMLQFVLTVIARRRSTPSGEAAADWALRFGARLAATRAST